MLINYNFFCIYICFYCLWIEINLNFYFLISIGDIKPIIEDNLKGITELVGKLDETMKARDIERKQFKEQHGIMTQEERDSAMKRQVREAEAQAKAQRAVKAAE